MKKSVLMFVVVAAAVLAVPAMSWAATIAGSDHDLTTKGWTLTEVCKSCHTPHNAIAGNAPLWNHTSTVATFTPYTSTTLNATNLSPGPQSKACLSCHDGTVAIDSFTGGAGTHTMTGGALVGIDLSNDHPVGFTYDLDLATADTGLVTPADASHVVTGIPLYASKMECASCHNVHDPVNGSFLRNTNDASALCFKCHNK